MKSHKYVIMGSPIPLARARFTQRRVWDSQRDIKLQSRLELSHQHNEQPFFDGPLHLEAIFYFGVTRGVSKKKMAQIQGSYYTSIPDLDNLIKYICDVGTGVLWHNDCIIASVSSKKCWDLEPRTEFTVIQLGK